MGNHEFSIDTSELLQPLREVLAEFLDVYKLVEFPLEWKEALV